MKNEIWLPIKKYEKLYEISNFGRVKSLYKNRLLKPSKNQNGYILVSLYKNGKHNWHRVHRLVAEAFISNPNNFACVNHKNGDKHNNIVDNLEWCTHSYNTKHAYETNLRKKYFGKDNALSKPINQYDLKGNYIKTWESRSIASKELNISGGNIWRSLNSNMSAGGYKWKYHKI